jgi:hypothetical protein
MLQRVVVAAFVITLAVSLLGGALLVAGQALSLVLGQGQWLTFLDATAKVPICAAASLCAIAGFLLSYRNDPAGTASGQEGR